MDHTEPYSTIYQQVRQHAINGDIRKSIELLKKICPNLSDYNKKVADILISNYSLALKNEDQGTINYQKKNQNVNEICVRILDLVNSLEPKKYIKKNNFLAKKVLISSDALKGKSNQESVFISYSSHDKDFVLRLTKDLVDNNINCWLDEWEIKVGDSILDKIDIGLEKSNFLVVVISSNSLNSKWVEREWKVKYWDEVNTGKIIVLPALIEDCEIPKLLKNKKYADFRKRYIRGANELISSIESHANRELTISSEDYNSPDYWLELGAQYFSRGQKDLSLHFINRAINMEPQHIVGQYSLGIVYAHLGRLDEALIATFKSAQFGNIDAKRYVTKLFIEKKQFKEALFYFDTIENEIEKNEDYYYDLGLIYKGLKEYENAIEMFNKAPNVYGAWNNKGLVFSYLGLVENAIEAFDKCISINSGDNAGYLNKANILTRNNNLDEAISLYLKAKEVNPNDPTPYCNLGVAYAAKIEYLDAIKSFNTAISIKPNYKDAWFNKAIAHHAIKQFQESYNAFQIVLHIEPSNELAKAFVESYNMTMKLDR